jgi:predicted hydrolase (HD superfamily)
MTKLEAGMTRDAAHALLTAHNEDPFHIEHGETVEATMRYFAREYDAENEAFWGIVGLLHDLDWEEYPTPEDHTLRAAEMIEVAGGTPELVHAIQSHAFGSNAACPQPNLWMEKILFACEELTGLIGAAVAMRPSKSVMDFSVKSLKKKFKDRRFAAGVSRDVIREGADMLGWELDELFDQTIKAMQSFAPDRDTFTGEDEPSAPLAFPR